MRLNLRLLLYRLPGAVMFYTDAELAAARARKVLKPVKIGSISNGLDVKSIQLSRRPYRAAERKAKVVFIGRLTERVKVHVLLDAMLDVDNDTFLSIVGDG